MLIKKMQVLIVDDAKLSRIILKKIINDSEFAEVVSEASNGAEAISLYRKLNPDIVTMDLFMPEMGGIEAIEKILKIDRDAIILAVTAADEENMIIEATEKGAKDFIKKPFNDKNIIKILKSFFY